MKGGKAPNHADGKGNRHGHLWPFSPPLRLASLGVCLVQSTHTWNAVSTVVIGSLAMLLLLPGVQGHGEVDELFEEAEIALVPYVGSPAVAVDGRLAPGEYSRYGRWTDADSGFAATFQRDDEALYVSLTSAVGGWMAVGFTPDVEEGMGFVVVGEVEGDLRAVSRVTQEISDEMAFASPPSPEDDGIMAFAARQGDGGILAELQLGLESSLWTLMPGELLPLVVAFNETSVEVPRGVEGSEVRFLRAYVFRPQDDPAEIRDLLDANISPVPGFVAVAVMTVGILAISIAFLVRRDEEGSG